MNDFDAKAAFAGLRSAVRDGVTPPSPAGVRARAQRQQRRRRTVTVAVVAAAVIAVLFGATTALRPTAAPPPGHTPTPPVTGGTPTRTPTPTPTPTSSPRPPLPEVRTSLAVPSRPSVTIDDPIAEVDWANATLTVPPRDYCPSGTLQFADGQTAGWPRMLLVLDRDGVGPPIAYGDLTGDGTAEAVVEAGCLLTDEAAHLITGLLVFTRDGDGVLRTLGGWTGPIEWQVHREIWVQDGRILTEQQWSTPGYDYAPGAAAAYQWDGDSFESVPSGLTPITVVDGATLGPPIDLGPDDGYVARALGCPGGIVRFGRFEEAEGRRFSRDGVVYELELAPSRPPHLLDLAGDGRRYALVEMHCHDATVTREQALFEGIGLRGQGILVLDRTATGFIAADIVFVPDHLVNTWYPSVPGTIDAYAMPYGGGVAVEPITWTWNGQYFQR